MNTVESKVRKNIFHVDMPHSVAYTALNVKNKNRLPVHMSTSDA